MANVIARVPEALLRSQSFTRTPFIRMMSGSAAVGTPGEGAGKGGGAGGKLYLICLLKFRGRPNGAL